MDFIHTYILTWRLPVALAIAALAVFPIRHAYRKLRNGDLDILTDGAVFQSFWATLLVGIAAFVYIYTIVLWLGVWLSLTARHLLSVRSVMASLLAVAICAFWYGVLHYFQYL